MSFLQILRLGFRQMVIVTVIVMTTAVSLGVSSPPSWADAADPYVRRYLGVKEPVPLKLNSQGEMRLFSAMQLSQGKRFFEENCKNCHVGGATLPDPTVSLSLEALQAAKPSRDDITSLVAFLRQPMTYDGMADTYSCRRVSESWLADEPAANLAAFILRSAEKAPGWGNTTF